MKGKRGFLGWGLTDMYAVIAFAVVIIIFFMIATFIAKNAAQVVGDVRTQAVSQYYLTQILDTTIEFEGKSETVAYLLSRAAARNNEPSPYHIQDLLTQHIQKHLELIVVEANTPGSVTCARFQALSQQPVIDVSVAKGRALGTACSRNQVRMLLAENVPIIFEVRLRD